MSLDVKFKMMGPLPVIYVVGRVVDIDVKRMAKHLERLRKGKHPKIVLDVSGTDFIDSHGLGAVVYYHTLLQKENRELIVLNANRSEASYVNRLFELTHLDKVLTIVTSLKSVVEGTGRPQPNAPAGVVPRQPAQT
jgi:anti-anti-sigma factor